MRYAALFSALLLIFSLILSIPALSTEIDGKLIRLHIIAGSNSEEDQNIKLYLRDEILKEFGERLSKLKSKEDAEETVKILLDEIEAFSNDKLVKKSYPYKVKCTLSEEAYPTREYRNFALPAGKYTSLRVIIGTGEGENWWCVLYPPLCMSGAKGAEEDAFIAAGFTPEEYKLITRSNGKYKIKFKLIELFNELFN